MDRIHDRARIDRSIGARFRNKCLCAIQRTLNLATYRIGSEVVVRSTPGQKRSRIVPGIQLQQALQVMPSLGKRFVTE